VKVQFRLAPLGMALALAGCAVGPDYLPASLAVPAFFASSATKASGPAGRWSGVDLGQWWRSFRDPELNALIARAVAANPDIEIAMTRLEEARTIVLAAIGAALPVGEGSASKAVGTGSDVTKSRVTTPMTSAVSTTGFQRVTEVGGVDAGWDLDIFGKHRREIEASQDDAEAAADDREGVLIGVVADVARAYLDMRALQARLAVAQRNIEVARRNLDLVQTRAKQGITNDLDVTLAQRELASVEATVRPLEAQISTSQYVLAVLLGVYPQDLVKELAAPRPIPAFPSRIAVGTPIDLLHRRPDILESERRLAAATARIGVATADLYPRLAITGAAGAEGGPIAPKGMPLTLIGAAGPVFYWPLLDFGTLDAEVDVADLATREREVAYKQTVLKAVAQVDEAVVSLRAQEARLRDLDRAVAAGKQAQSLASERYDRGLTDFLNVLDAERQEYDLEDQYVVAQQAAGERLVDLYKALGGGWQAYQEVPPIRQPQPAIEAEVTRALAPKNIHDYLKSEQPLAK
jgi:NodT family efflux transporter outer membrane factor (OMF) lipoprotein